jgi:tetratricopeptide (TPR) repeat protein
MRRGIILHAKRLAVGALLPCLIGCLAACDAHEPAPPPPERTDPERVEAALEAAEEYLITGDTAKAGAILNVLLEQEPDAVDALELMGRVELLETAAADARRDRGAARAHREAAYDCYRRAAAASPTSAGLRHNAGIIAMGLDRLDEARRHFAEAETLSPRNPQHPLFAAQVEIREQAWPAARRALSRTLALDPDEPVAYASTAIVDLEEQRFDDALRNIHEARVIAPDDLRFRVQEARILRRSGSPRRALALLVGLDEGDRATAGVANELASAHADLGDHAAAATVWANRYQRDPAAGDADRVAALAGLAMVSAGRLEDARLWLQQARLAGGEAPEIAELERVLDGQRR